MTFRGSKRSSSSPCGPGSPRPRPSSPWSCAGSCRSRHCAPRSSLAMLKGVDPHYPRHPRVAFVFDPALSSANSRSVDGAHCRRGAAGQEFREPSQRRRRIRPESCRHLAHGLAAHAGVGGSRGTVRLFKRELAAATVPGVVNGALVNHVPLGLAGVGSSSASMGSDPAADTVGVGYVTITPRYFATMGIPLLRGRDFTDADMTPDAAVAIITSAMGAPLLAGWHGPAGPRAHRAERLRLRSRLPEADPGPCHRDRRRRAGEI